ncbi:50S ribosomal protein L29 [Candidatus Dependentiae bacterium]|nr:50S ribosomal protein L29 [Candidatus Dependentiae bacterium]
MNKEDFKKMDKNSLKQEVLKLKKELFDLKFKSRAGDVKDYSQFKKLRANIARGLTVLNSKIFK